MFYRSFIPLTCTSISCLSILTANVGDGGTSASVTTVPAACIGDVTASSSNSSVATVSKASNGYWSIYPRGSGSCIITFRCGDQTATCSVTVNTIKCTGLTINSCSPTTIYTQGMLDKTCICTFSVSPSNCSEPVTVTSSNSSVVSVYYDPNVWTRETDITGISAGTATITIRCGNYSQSFNVTVIDGYK